MKTIRRVIFGLLVIGCLIGLAQSLGLRPSADKLVSVLFVCGLASPFGLVIWSAVCLESEKTLTRVALAMVFFFMLALCYIIGKLPA